MLSAEPKSRVVASHKETTAARDGGRSCACPRGAECPSPTANSAVGSGADVITTCDKIMAAPLAGGGIPDARYIREKIPIVKIASMLELEVFDNRMVRCWHPERHHHGDRTPSVGVYARYNKLKFFGHACDGKPLGPIDLVVDVRGPTPKEAIRWIAQRFDVPLIPRGKHLVKKNEQVARYGFERPIELLVRSGLWAKMSRPAQALVVVFVERADESHCTEHWASSISYQGLVRYLGLKSSASIAKGLQELEVIGWLRRSRVPPTRTGQGPVRETNKYIITPSLTRCETWLTPPLPKSAPQSTKNARCEPSSVPSGPELGGTQRRGNVV